MPVISSESAGPSSATADSATRVWPIPLVIAGSFGVYLLASLFAVMVATFVVEGSDGLEALRDQDRIAAVLRSPLGMTITVVLPQVGMLLPILAAAIASPVPFTTRLGLRRGDWPLGLWLVAALGTPMVGMISSLIVGGLMGESETLEEMSDVFRNLGQAGYLWPLALMIGATPGICEELVFRGYVQTRLVHVGGAGVGILITSVIFAAFHMDWVHSTAVFALGVYLGWIAWAGGSIWPAMLGHFVNNFLSVVAVVVLPEAVTDGTLADEAVAEMPAGIAVGFAVVVLLSGVCLLMTFSSAWRHRRRNAVGSTPVADQNGG